MIVSMPENGVAPERASHAAHAGEPRDSSGTRSPAEQAGTPALRDAFGRTLQNLFNVTVDCVRGRYDR